MGFGEAVDNYREGTDNGGYYGYHKHNSKLNEWVEELEDKFPRGINLQYIEVSPAIEKVQARAHNPSGERPYIRVAEWVFDEYSDEYVKSVVAHELAHVWMFNNGYRYDDKDKIFNWVLGRIGADITHSEPGGQKYRIMERFRQIEQDDTEQQYLSAREIME